MDDLTFRCRQCGKPIFDHEAAMLHMQRLEGHTVDQLLDLEPGDPA